MLLQWCSHCALREISGDSVPWASMGWEDCKSDPRWHFLLKYRQPRDITHLPAWIAIHTNELISGGKSLLPEWVGEETSSLTLQPEQDSGFSLLFFSAFTNSAISYGYTQHLQPRPWTWDLCVMHPRLCTQNHTHSSAKEQHRVSTCPPCSQEILSYT